MMCCHEYELVCMSEDWALHNFRNVVQVAYIQNFQCLCCSLEVFLNDRRNVVWMCSQQPVCDGAGDT